ncbi:MAG: HEAT repeat domain-containing protein [Chloroflexi bacterium]|nr:HEAT repeat domain-containing protein [Chloroflexota bacterium]
MDRKPSLNYLLDELKDSNRPVSISKLVNLSDLTPEEVKQFRKDWPAIGARKRTEVVKRLVQLAEDNFELNFDIVFSCCVADPEVDVRIRAAEGLGESEDPAFIETLIGLLENDDDPSVRATAASSLARFSEMAEINRLRPRHAERLGETLLAVATNKTEEIEVRRRALEALGPMSLPEVTWAIREAYESNSYPLKVGALYAMGQNCDPIWLPTLLEELHSSNAEIRYECVSACGEIGDEEAVPYLVPLTTDPDYQVRLAAVDALGKIGGEESRRALQECARCEDASLREAAAEALDSVAGDEDPLYLSFRT